MSAELNATADGRLGFVAEPNDTVRGTISILWTCLSTIYICTWSALHLDIPYRRRSKWQILWRKTKWMLAAIAAPEVIALIAMKERSDAGKLLEGPDWPFVESSVTHGFYVLMRGMRLRFEDGTTLALDGDCLKRCVRAGMFDLCSLSEDAILDKSKASWLAKSFLLGQLGYFLAQLIGRWAQHLAVTPLELLTLGIAICTGIAYAAWWEKPLDVETATKMFVGKSETFWELMDPRRHARRFAPPTAASSNDSGAGTSGVLWQNAMVTFFEDSSQWPFLPDFWWFGDTPPIAARWAPVEKRLKKLHPLSYPSEDFDLCKANLRKIETLMALRRLQQLPQKHHINALFRLFSINQIFGQGPRSNLNHALLAGFCLASLLFGTCHLLGWAFEFPSMTEALLWRIASIICAAVPVVFAGALGFSRLVPKYSLGFDALISIAMLVYFTVRCYLLVAVFISFRSMPPSAFKRVEWSAYIPHIG